jgi:hypothetical protein
MDPNKHMDKFLSICDIHLIEHDDVMVRFFIQTLVCLAYDWYISLPAQSFGLLDDMEDMFMTMYAQPISYHTLVTLFTQIRLLKGERIIDFNLCLFKTLNQILEEQRPNVPIIFRCYKIKYIVAGYKKSKKY